MLTFKKACKKLNDVFKRSKEVTEGVEKIIPYLTIVSTGVAVGGGVLTTAVIIAASAAAVNGLSSILRLVTDPAKGDSLSGEERFELCFHLYCHQAYAMATATILKKHDISDINTRKISEQKVISLEEIETYWDFELDILGNSKELFSVYSDHLRYMIKSERTISSDEGDVIKEIENAAQSYLLQLISKPSDLTSEWIFRYVRLNELLRQRSVKDSLPENIVKAIEAVLDNFVSKTSSRSQQAWNDYRDYLQKLPKVEIFESKFGIEDLYILPNYTYYQAKGKGAARNKPQQDILRKHLAEFLTMLISNRVQSSDTIFIFGEPGIGKTSISQIFASNLSKIEYMHPVFIPLHKINPDKDLHDEVVDFLSQTLPKEAVDNLPYESNLVFIFDAFDELAHATRERIGEFFRQIDNFSKGSLYRNATVIVTGRDTLFSRDDVLIPRHSHVITLAPFDKEQVWEWSEKWNKLTNRYFDGTQFLDEDTENKSDLHDFATQPFLLYLLAKLDEEGYTIDKEIIRSSRAQVYRYITKWCCERHDRHKRQSKDITITGAEMRRFLRITGFCTLAYGSRLIDIGHLQQMLEQLEDRSEADQYINYAAEQTIMSFYLDKVDKEHWQFKHKSFGEYFAAEYIADSLHRLIAQKEDPDDDKQLYFEKSDEEAAALWSELFARNIITPEIQLLLEPMLGDWVSFVRGVKQEKTTQGLENLLVRCKTLYMRFINERDMKYLSEHADKFSIETTQAWANFGISTLLFGNLCARTLSQKGNQIYFELDHRAGEKCWKIFSVVKRNLDLSDLKTAYRLFKGASLYTETSLNKYLLSALPFVRLFNKQVLTADDCEINEILDESPVFSFHDCQMSFADFSGYNWGNGEFINVRLKYSYFCNSEQNYIKFIDSDLTGADFSNTSISNSQFIGYVFEGVCFKNAIIKDVRFSLPSEELNKTKQQKLSHINFQNCSFLDVDLFCTEFERCSFKEAFLTKVNLEKSKFSSVDFTNIVIKKSNMRNVKFSSDPLILSQKEIDQLLSSVSSYENPSESFLQEEQVIEAFEVDIPEMDEISECDFSGSDFRGADLTGAVFKNCKLINADFRGADFQGAILSNAVLSNADFRDIRYNYDKLEKMELEVDDFEEEIEVYDELEEDEKIEKNELEDNEESYEIEVEEELELDILVEDEESIETKDSGEQYKLEDALKVLKIIEKEFPENLIHDIKDNKHLVPAFEEDNESKTEDEQDEEEIELFDDEDEIGAIPEEIDSEDEEYILEKKEDGRIDFRGAILKDVDFTNSDLSGADFRSATFSYSPEIRKFIDSFKMQPTDEDIITS